MTDEQAVLDIEQQRCNLINAGTIDEIDMLLAEGYQHVHANGLITGKRETLDRFRATPRRIERGELNVRIWGDTALLLGTLDNFIPVTGGPDRIMHGMATQVLRRAEMSWHFEAFQLTLVQP